MRTQGNQGPSGLTPISPASIILAMRSDHEQTESVESASYRELRLLSEVQATPNASQRDLSRRARIALGLTNVLLRNLSQKGYIRITQAGWKRWIYAVTPSGFTRKVQLTVSYVHRVLDHYQQVRRTLREELALLALNEESRIAIYGTGEFAELVYLGLREIGIEEIDIFAMDGTGGGRFLGMSVRPGTALRPEAYDRVVVALLKEADSAQVELRGMGVTSDKLVTFFANEGTTEEGR